MTSYVIYVSHPPSSITCRLDSLKPEDYPRLPLFTAAPEKCVLLNQVFWLVLDDAFSWRSMSRLSCNTVEEVEHLAESQYVSIAASKSGPALRAVPKISKHLVAYMAGLDAVSPYNRLQGLHVRSSCQGHCGASSHAGVQQPEPAQERALHGLPQAQARGMVPRGPKA